jgi:hypothetical protein
MRCLIAPFQGTSGRLQIARRVPRAASRSTVAPGCINHGGRVMGDSVCTRRCDLSTRAPAASCGALVRCIVSGHWYSKAAGTFAICCAESTSTAEMGMPNAPTILSALTCCAFGGVARRSRPREDALWRSGRAAITCHCAWAWRSDNLATMPGPIRSMTPTGDRVVTSHRAAQGDAVEAVSARVRK